MAYAVSVAETSNCTKGYGVTYNNCHGIKRGSIVPCQNVGRNRMCIFGTKEESFEAFKRIWGSPRGYKGQYPTMRHAQVWSGNDRADHWLRIVNSKY